MNVKSLLEKMISELIYESFEEENFLIISNKREERTSR